MSSRSFDASTLSSLPTSITVSAALEYASSADSIANLALAIARSAPVLDRLSHLAFGGIDLFPCDVCNGFRRPLLFLKFGTFLCKLGVHLLFGFSSGLGNLSISLSIQFVDLFKQFRLLFGGGIEFLPLLFKGNTDCLFLPLLVGFLGLCRPFLNTSI